jgi:RNA polymerase sigma factor (sigma-70 family)
MDEPLAARFEHSRDHLRGVAYRMLGSVTEADDAVQEAWLRLSRADAGAVGNLGGWLTTVVARVCLDMLRARATKREVPPDTAPDPATVASPEDEALLADSVGLALLVVLDTLAPAERLAFVLHDMFAVPFEEIAPIVGRTPAAARQLASRARRRVQGSPPALDADASRRKKIVDAFLAASRNGDFEGLLAVLDPDVAFRADEAAQRLGSLGEMRGAATVAEAFKGRATAARPALVDGGFALAVVLGGQLRIVVRLIISGERISAIEAVADAEQIGTFDVEMLERE